MGDSTIGHLGGQHYRAFGGQHYRAFGEANSGEKGFSPPFPRWLDRDPDGAEVNHDAAEWWPAGAVVDEPDPALSSETDASALGAREKTVLWGNGGPTTPP